MKDEIFQDAENLKNVLELVPFVFKKGQIIIVAQSEKNTKTNRCC